MLVSSIVGLWLPIAAVQRGRQWETRGCLLSSQQQGRVGRVGGTARSVPWRPKSPTVVPGGRSTYRRSLPGSPLFGKRGPGQWQPCYEDHVFTWPQAAYPAGAAVEAAAMVKAARCGCGVSYRHPIN